MLLRIFTEPQQGAAYDSLLTVAQLSESLNFNLVAEGVETFDEYLALRDCGIKLMQGYLFARPGFESLPAVTLPEAR